MPPSVITGGLAVALMFSLTHSAARPRTGLSGLVLADRHGAATLAAPESCVANKAGDSSDEFLDLVVPLLELIEEFRSTVAGIAANHCVHHCLLESRRGMRLDAGRSSSNAGSSVKTSALRGHS